jgi:hypothetical protein
MAKSLSADGSEGPHDIVKDEDQRRKEVYKWYKHYAKPTKETMCRIAESTNDAEIVRLDVELLPWNLEETEVNKEAMKSLKKKKTEKKSEEKEERNKTEKKDKEKSEKKDKEKSEKKEKKKDEKKDKEKSEKKDKEKSEKKDKERSKTENKEEKNKAEKKEKEKKDKKEKKMKDRREDIAREEDIAAESNDYIKCPTLPKEQKGNSSTTVDSSYNDSNRSLDLDISSHSWQLGYENKDEDFDLIAKQLRTVKAQAESKKRGQEIRSKIESSTMTIMEEHKRKKEERRLKREAAKEKSILENAGQEKIKAEEVRRQFIFNWYSRMSMPNREDFKEKVAAQSSIGITPEDVDSLPWNSTGKMVSIAKMNALTRATMQKQ